MFRRLGQFLRKIFLRPSEDRAETLPDTGSPEHPTGLPETDFLQSIVERLTEDEALTADLVDGAARRLLEWGIAQARTILQETGLSEESQARLAALRQRIREIARQVGQLQPDEQETALRKLL